MNARKAALSVTSGTPRILLGITGGISAYKAVEIASLLRQQGMDVYVMMTEAATRFITPLTLQAITHHPVALDQFELSPYGEIEHVNLSQSVDLIVIAPATANCIGKLACGIADDFLTTALLAATAPVVLAPAMNDQMWLNPIVQENVKRLADRGYQIIEPEVGRLACESVGPGRLAEPETIVYKAMQVLKQGSGGPANRRKMKRRALSSQATR